MSTKEKNDFYVVLFVVIKKNSVSPVWSIDWKKANIFVDIAEENTCAQF